MKHEFSRRLGALTLALVLALSCAVTPAWADDEPSISIEFAADTPNPLELTAGGESVILTTELTDTTPDPSQDTLTWPSWTCVTSSTDSTPSDIVRLEPLGGSIAENRREIVPVKAGTAYIQVSCTLTVHATGETLTAVTGIPVTVKPSPESVTLNKTVLSLEQGKSETLKATVKPDGASQTVTWSSSKPGVVSVDQNGRITALKKGDTIEDSTAIITALASNNISKAQCRVTVTDVTPTITLNKNTLVLRVNGKEKLTATTVPAGSKVKWTSSSPTNIKVDENTGLVTALKANAPAVITATLLDSDGKPVKVNNRDVTAACSVVATDDNSVTITGVTLSETSHSIPVGGSFQLAATVSPDNAANKTVVWSSTDETIATVEDGKVTALKAGTVGITATALYGGLSDVCTVKVTPAATGINLVPSGDIVLSTSGSQTKFTLTYGRTSRSDFVTATASITPSNSEDAILWKSDNVTVVTVSGTDTSATITRRGPGTAKITAVPVGPDGEPRKGVKAAELEVTVSGIKLKKDPVTIAEYRQDSLEYDAYGDAATNGADWEFISTDPAVVTVDAKAGTLMARNKGSAVITVTKGTGSYYTDTCTVNVVEDTSGLITLSGSHPAGSPISMSTASAVSQAGSGTLASVLDAVCRDKTKVVSANGAVTSYGLQYVTNLSVVSTDQGILHDQHHSSSDTGSGVGIQDIYYPNGNASQGQRSLQDLSFVPRSTFSGTAEINYTGRSANNQNFTGIIRVSVSGTGDVIYASSEGSVVNFQSDDFNLYHPNLSSVSFTPPLDSRGTLYYNYSSASQPGTKVKASDSYSRTGTPSLDRVSFVPASGYEGAVTISYKGKDTSGRSITGTVTINVTNNKGGGGAVTDIYYAAAKDGWVTVRPSDFSNASRYALGETLSYVRFTPPPSSEGTLFYNYRGFGNYDGTVASTTSYYYSGTPSLGGVTFVPTTTTPDTVEIGYTGYTTRGNTFTGTIHIGEDAAAAQQGGLRYTVFTGKSVNLNAIDFNTACVAATGASLNYVLFSPLPAVGEGMLRYTHGNSSTTYSLSTTTRCYRSSSNSWDTQLNNVSFLASNNFTGTVTIPFTGYNTNNTSFTGEVVITVTPPTSGDSVYYGTTASPIQLSSYRMSSACSGALSGTLSYITFTSLPSSSAGRLYLGYTNFNHSGTQVNTGTRYYVSGSPGIDQISFVPRGRYSGQVSVGYTATNTNGQSVTGLITFNISSTGSSNYFNDLGGHAWAAPAVDYLYQNGVTNGVTSTAYGPNQRILRRDFVLMLCRAFKFSGGSGYSFADVPTNAYYANAVATARQMGIVSGDGRNFMPDSQITRQDAMVMIKNALDAAGWNVGSASTSILGRFPDGTSVSSYARNAVSTLVQMGAVNGDNGMLYPHNSITRAEAAVILHFVMTM